MTQVLPYYCFSWRYIAWLSLEGTLEDLFCPSPAGWGKVNSGSMLRFVSGLIVSSKMIKSIYPQTTCSNVWNQSKKLFRMLKWNLLYFNLWPVTMVLLSWHLLKVFKHVLFQAEPSQLSQPLLIWEIILTLSNLHGPLLDSLQCVLVCLILDLAFCYGVLNRREGWAPLTCCNYFPYCNQRHR